MDYKSSLMLQLTHLPYHNAKILVFNCCIIYDFFLPVSKPDSFCYTNEQPVWVNRM